MMSQRNQKIGVISVGVYLGALAVLVPVLSEDIWEQLAALCLALAVPPALLFPFMYLFFPWHKTKAGVMLMLSSVGMMLLVVLAAVFRVLEVEAPEWVRAAVYFVITTGMWYQFLLLGYSWRKNARYRKHYQLGKLAEKIDKIDQ